MPKRQASPDGLADNVTAFTYNPSSDVEKVILRACEVLRARSEKHAAHQAKAEAERLAEERSFDRQFRQWLKARAHLVTAVHAVDRALAPEGMAVSLSDEWVQPTYLALAQVQLTITGRPTEALLEIAVNMDLNQRGWVVRGEAPIKDIKMPTAKSASPSDYVAVLLTYLDSALLERERRVPRVCKHCGRS